MTETAERSIALRPATRDDVPALSNVLARSFQSCPAWGWYLPPEAPNRVSRMQRFFAGLLTGVYLREGRECLVPDDLSGAVLVDPPDGWKLSVGDNLRLTRAMLRAFGRHVTRPIRGFGRLDKGHPAQPHYYVSVLGVDPEAAAPGIAAGLLRPVLSRADAERLPAYLETGRPKSRDFFERHGFEVTQELSMPGDGPPVWRMWREAK